MPKVVKTQEDFFETEALVKAGQLTQNRHTLLISIQDLIDCSHSVAVGSGWWHTESIFGEHTTTAIPKERSFGEIIALIHSEVSEAMEGGRKDKQDDHLPEFLSVEVELADALHRIFDLAGAMKLKLGEAYVAKALYNMQREDHKPAAREAEGGKKF